MFETVFIVVTTYAPPQLSYNAAAKVWSLMQEEENLQLKLRISVMGGGCSGFQYAFAFESDHEADDGLYPHCLDELIRPEPDEAVVGLPEPELGAQVVLIVDPISLAYLYGATIDYKEDVQGARFLVINPNAKTTCGCGASFDA